MSTDWPTPMRNAPRGLDRRGPGIVGRRVADGLLDVALDDRPRLPQRGRHEIGAGRQVHDPIPPGIVGRAVVDDAEATFAVDEGLTHDQHARAGNRLARFIGDAPAEHAHPGQREVELLDDLLVEDLQRPAGFERPALTVAQRQVAAAPGGDVVAAGGQVGEFVSAVGVRADRAPFAALVGRCQRDLRPPQRTAGVGRGHAAANHRRPARGRRPAATPDTVGHDGLAVRHRREAPRTIARTTGRNSVNKMTITAETAQEDTPPNPTNSLRAGASRSQPVAKPCRRPLRVPHQDVVCCPRAVHGVASVSGTVFDSSSPSVNFTARGRSDSR